MRLVLRLDTALSLVVREKNHVGKGPVRTGVTAIFPNSKVSHHLFANWYTLNGNGEMTGTTWVTESGFLETPIMMPCRMML
jgi:L-aminopeptidase/D-esterase-like protein